MRDNNKVNSGIVGAKTAFRIFSKSSHTSIMIEMTKEMYNFDDDG